MNPDETDYAVVIAIENYEKLERLNGALKDAEAFVLWLKEKAGFVGEEGEKRIAFVHSIDSPGNAVPTRALVDEAFQDIIRKAIASGVALRRLYVYFVGHGSLQVSDYAETVTLLFAPFSDDRFFQNMSASSCCVRLASRRLFREQLIFLDCCRNMLTDSKIEGQTVYFELPTSIPAQPLPQQWIYFGAERGYESYRRPMYGSDVDRGFFTAALLEGLHGAAVDPVDQSGQFQITPRSLWRYLQDRVPAIAKQNGRGRIQYPDWQPRRDIGSREPDLVILNDVTPPGCVTLTTNLPVEHLYIYKADLKEQVADCRMEQRKAVITISSGHYVAYAFNSDRRYSLPFNLIIDEPTNTNISLENITWP